MGGTDNAGPPFLLGRNRWAWRAHLLLTDAPRCADVSDSMGEVSGPEICNEGAVASLTTTVGGAFGIMGVTDNIPSTGYCSGA